MADSGLQAEPPEPPRPSRDRDRRERDDDRPRRRERDDDDDYRPRRREEPNAVEIIIPYKNPKGLIAYYLGVFSLIPVAGLLLGPAALILGILGVRASVANPSAKGGAHAITGIVLGSLTSLANFGCLGFVLYGAFVTR